MELKNTKLLLCGDLQHSFGKAALSFAVTCSFQRLYWKYFPTDLKKLVHFRCCLFNTLMEYLQINLSLYIQPARRGSIIIIQIANDSICLSLWLNDCKERIFPLISNLSSLSSLSSFNSAKLDSPPPSLPPLFVARDRCSRGLHTHVDGCSKVLLHINYPCVPFLVNGPWIQRYEWVEQRGNKVPLLVNIQSSKPNCWLCAIFELPTAGFRIKGS